MESDEVLQIHKQKPPEPIEIPLLDKNGQIVPELEDTLAEWFIGYSVEVDRDALLEEAEREEAENGQSLDGNPVLAAAAKANPSLEDIRALNLPPVFRAMDVPCCTRFVSRTTKIPGILPTDFRVLKLFENHSKKVGRNYVLLSEFIGFYQDQSKLKPDAVRQNLANMGIQNDFKVVVDASDATIDTDPRLCTNENILPRSKLSSNDELFNQLLELAQQSQGDENDGVWQLIMSISTNKALLRQVLHLEQLDELLTIDQEEGASAGDSTKEQSTDADLNVYKILYVLQVLQSLINEYRQQNRCSIILYSESPAGEAPSVKADTETQQAGASAQGNVDGKPN